MAARGAKSEVNVIISIVISMGKYGGEERVSLWMEKCAR